MCLFPKNKQRNKQNDKYFDRNDDEVRHFVANISIETLTKMEIYTTISLLVLFM